jgi:hypothetical protein
VRLAALAVLLVVRTAQQDVAARARELSRACSRF